MSTKIPSLISLNFNNYTPVEETNIDFEGLHLHWKPAVDVFDADESLIIEVDLPGVNQDDVALYLANNILTIEGQRSGPDLSGNELVQERGFGRFQRWIRLPATIDDAAKAQAHLTNGVLRITIPKQGVTTMPAQVITGPRTEMDRNFEAYLREKPELEANLAGHVVAYYDGKRIAEGKDAEDLLENIPEQYRRQSLFIKDVPSRPVIFRRPFFMRRESA